MKAFDSIAPHAHWLLRAAIASVFLFHGITKFPVLGMMAEMMQMPFLMVLMLAVAETLAGLLILIGGFGPDWATRLAGLIVAVDMVGAIMLVHWQHGWNSVNMGTGNEGRGMGEPDIVARGGPEKLSDGVVWTCSRQRRCHPSPHRFVLTE